MFINLEAKLRMSSFKFILIYGGRLKSTYIVIKTFVDFLYKTFISSQAKFERAVAEWIKRRTSDSR